MISCREQSNTETLGFRSGVSPSKAGMGSLGQGGTPGGGTSKLLRAVSQAGSGQAQMERERNTPAILEAEKKKKPYCAGLELRGLGLR